MLKRLLDFAVSVAGLVLFSPVFLVVGCLVMLEDGGPVFYRGVRVGLHGRPFCMFKFRTMVVNGEKIGSTSTAEDDPRITLVGQFLRRYKVDELPQLINVLKGEMSLVGPRPQVQWAVALYSADERTLLSVRPGVTDYASLRFRNEGELLQGSPDPDREYLEKIAPEKIRLGLEYVRHHNMLIDLKILVATIGALIGVDPSWCLPYPAIVRKDRGLLGDA